LHGDGWQFAAEQDSPEGGRDCRLLDWQTGATATIVGGAGDPDSDGTTVNVQFYPPHQTNAVVRTGHHVGYRPPGKDFYVIPNYFDLHTDRTGGYVSTGGQSIAGRFSLYRGGLYVTGTGEVPPSQPPLAYRANLVTDTHETYTPGFGIFQSDGSIKVSGGPRLVATGAALDLQGAVWASPTDFVTYSNLVQTLLPTKDGVTGTFTIPGIASGADGSVTFDAGLYVSHTNPGARPSMFTGTFLMYDLDFGTDRTVTCVDGVITDVA
jgi:hypothetical protein